MVLFSKKLSLQSINFTPEWNLHPWEWGSIPDKLHDNFELNGIIHPPLVIPVAESRYSIVAGAKRLHFLKKNYSSTPVHCMVLEQTTPITELLNLILAEQNCSSSLSLAEKARFTEIALREFSIDDALNTFRNALQLPKGRAIVKNLQQLLQQDDEFIIEVHEGRIQDKMAAQLLSLEDKLDRTALVRLFKELGMGDGKQRKLFNLIRDIAYRKNLSISNYLQQHHIAEILEHTEMNNPQKVQNLGNLLQKENSPSSSRAEDLFLQEVKNLQLKPNQYVSHSPSFEKDDVTLSITFKSLQDCQQYLKQRNNSQKD